MDVLVQSDSVMNHRYLQKNKAGRQTPQISVERHTGLEFGRLQAEGKAWNQPSAPVRGPIERCSVFVITSEASGGGLWNKDQIKDNEQIRREQSANEIRLEWTHINLLIMTNKRTVVFSFLGPSDCSSLIKESGIELEAARLGDYDNQAITQVWSLKGSETGK